MSLNSAPSVDGGEIGRAQALQAQAEGVQPHSDMNPVLLKPETDCSSQLIVHGKVVGRLHSKDFSYSKKERLAPVLESYYRLTQKYDTIIVEGAGSPAEINLRAGDIANMGFAEAVNCPVVLLGNIDKGGVFAQLVGTLELMSREDRKRIVGLVINGFRGDPSLLTSAIQWVEERTRLPILGIIPFIPGLTLDSEDSLVIEQKENICENSLHVCVPALPRISNHTDFDALRLHPQVNFNYVAPGQLPKKMDLLILPGSKNVQEDLLWLKKEKWEPVIERHLRYEGRILGICGGYQMLGKWIHNPKGVESSKGSIEGLGWLNVETTLNKSKKVTKSEAFFYQCGSKINGYEIHCGETSGPDCRRPFSTSPGGMDGARSQDEQVMGTYLHGLFDNPKSARSILEWAGLSSCSTPDISQKREESINRLADVVTAEIDIDKLFSLVS